VSFSFFPPEFNTELVHTARGSGQLSLAASAWDVLAAGLCSAAGSLVPAISALIANWPGPSVLEIAGAIAQYASWLNATAAQVADVAAKAATAADALETAFAMTVPPPVIEANRAWFRKLATTNVLGQDALAVAATEAHYLEMWAQDAATLNGYMTAWRDAVRMSAYGKRAAATDSTDATAAGTGMAPLTNSSTERRWALSSLTAREAKPGHSGPSGPSGTAPDSERAAEAVSTASAAERLAMYPISTLAQASRICEADGAALSGTRDSLVNRRAQLKVCDERLLVGRADRQQYSWGSPVSARMAHAMSLGGLSVPSTWPAPPGLRNTTQVFVNFQRRAQTLSSDGARGSGHYH
ncbi:PPE family protein, partial [Mycobacterium terramassiliense]